MTMDPLGPMPAALPAARAERAYPNHTAATRDASPAMQVPSPQAVTADGTPGASTPLGELNDAVARLNDSMQARSQSLEFSIDEDSKRTIVKVVDLATREVVRQIPTEEALQISKSLDRFSGMLIRQKA